VSVLDASALLAYLFEEPGGEVVAAIIDGACISAVNLSEVATRVARNGLTPNEFAGDIERLNLEVVPFLADDALAAANLEPHTRRFGLSLGDRACLALGLARREPVYTADRVWAELDIGAKVLTIR
jgi:PIN domain nuclease of toxin-antitoxin system